MNRFVGKAAVVTGAGGGMGAAIVEKLVEEGLQVVAVDINSNNFDAMSKKLAGKKGTFHSKVADLTKEEDILEVFKWTLDNLGPVHVLVNAAGVYILGSLIDGDVQNWRKIFEVNVIGLCIATREAVIQMKAKDIDGHIVHINSIAGHSVSDFPGANAYPASKFAVTALTETLRQELRHAGTKIKISSVSPGSTDTKIFEHSNAVIDEEFQKMWQENPFLRPEDIADAVAFVVSTPPHVQVHELTIKPIGERYL